MIDRLLISFNRNINIKADFGEKIGNIGLGLLRIGFGKSVTVEQISDDVIFTKKVHSTSARVAAVALFIIAFPLTIPLAAIGSLGATFSKSHWQMFNSYIEPSIPPKNKAASIIRRQVHFGDVRCRLFDKTQPPAEVAAAESIDLRDKN
jgi:hypothetical protein